ncbi:MULTISPECIES: chaperone NapD [Thalassomonas]|uniref:Chaperone NapD n=1 Tax=Thalassomonas actiniarum TaxID=485447 RepID=A0AAE9YRP3_9GAMM|nr:MULTISPECIES: chaperone NapD [Thalassomonas]WDD99995.1 chaperone NapD [Thalassomonas actiniarum]
MPDNTLINDKGGVNHYAPDSPEPSGEYHVASFVAHAVVTQLDDVKQQIKQIQGAEIHAVSPEGKIVFTIEDFSQKGIGQKIDTLKYHTGLYNLAPVYHQFLPETNQAI